VVHVQWPVQLVLGPQKKGLLLRMSIYILNIYCLVMNVVENGPSLPQSTGRKTQTYVHTHPVFTPDFSHSYGKLASICLLLSTFKFAYGG
jgi:hypothetical protein